MDFSRNWQVGLFKNVMLKVFPQCSRQPEIYFLISRRLIFTCQPLEASPSTTVPLIWVWISSASRVSSCVCKLLLQIKWKKKFGASTSVNIRMQKVWSFYRWVNFIPVSRWYTIQRKGHLSNTWRILVYLKSELHSCCHMDGTYENMANKSWKAFFPKFQESCSVLQWWRKALLTVIKPY